MHELIYENVEKANSVKKVLSSHEPYQIAPGGDNDFPFTLSADERKAGSTLTAAPLIGTARRPSTTLVVQ